MKSQPTPVRSVKTAKVGWRRENGARAYRQGHGAEWWAALWLMAKGYQILGFRLKTRAGEIDILARRARTLVVVEVKRRRSLDEAILSLGPDQYDRLLRAGHSVLNGRPSLQGLELRLDLVALAPRRVPRHLRGLVLSRGPHDAG